MLEVVSWVNLADILDIFFGSWRLRGSPYNISTASLVAPVDVARSVPFDETLSAREDIWWVHQMQESGLELVQLTQPLVRIHAQAGYARARQRDSFGSQRDWAERLEAHRGGLGRRYLLGLALRDALLQRRAGDLKRTLALGFSRTLSM